MTNWLRAREAACYQLRELGLGMLQAERAMDAVQMALRDGGFVVVRAKDHNTAIRNVGFQVYSDNTGKPNGMGMALEAMLTEAGKETQVTT